MVCVWVVFEIQATDAEYVLVLAGDHLYRMDYAAMIDFCRKKSADAVVACMKVPLTQASSFGIMSIDEVQTLASLSVLKYVAKHTAQYGTPLEVPNKDPLTFAAAREKEGEQRANQLAARVFGKDVRVNRVDTDRWGMLVKALGAA